MNGEIVAGGKGKGKRLDQLFGPYVVLIDRIYDKFVVSENMNRRIMQFSLKNKDEISGKVLVRDIISLGLAMDNQGALYVSNFEQDEVRRYEPGDQGGVIVTGGNGSGATLDQLNGPRNIFVDHNYSVYVSEMLNHRVTKWSHNGTRASIVAGGNGVGNTVQHLNRPSGIFFDSTDAVYVVDQTNHRVMRLLKGAQQGEIILGGIGEGSKDDQFSSPASIAFDRERNLYVIDRNNHRIQRFDLQI